MRVGLGVAFAACCGVAAAQNVSEQYLLAAANRDRATQGWRR